MIILASQNPHKLKEFQAILPDLKFELSKESLDDIKEDGSTYLENALIKAKAVYDKTKRMAIADDSGLEIEALDNFPGIFSARFAYPITNYKIKNQLILDRMKGINNRKACFVCAVVLITEDGSIYHATGKLEGTIDTKMTGEKGFGYDPIFIPDGYDRSLGCLESIVKNLMSHRYKALMHLLNKLPQKLLRKERGL